MKQNIHQIIKTIDDYLFEKNLRTISPVEANAILEKKGLLPDSSTRPGKPLRVLLRNGLIPHAYQPNGKGTAWFIPYSAGKNTGDLSTLTMHPSNGNSLHGSMNSGYEKFQEYREKYKPDSVQFLIVAEAPPVAEDRFFYFPDVPEYDHLFLGVTNTLYPGLKKTYINSHRDRSLKIKLLRHFQSEGFYLMDLSEKPVTERDRKNISAHVTGLLQRMESCVKSSTTIIIIKANVYDCAYHAINSKYPGQVVDIRIPFPANGNQKEFQNLFMKALKQGGYNEKPAN